MARHVSIESISPSNHSTYLGGCPVTVLAGHCDNGWANLSFPISRANVACNVLQGHTISPRKALHHIPTLLLSFPSPVHLGIHLPAEKRQGAAEGPSLGSPPSLRQMKWSLLGALPESMRQFQMRNGTGASEKQIIPAAPFNTSKKQALCVCVKMGNILFFGVWETVFSS